ncbi:hypothetical protein GTS_01020 [Gandjariella thermophila]|uniref:Uncharacterized protein n=1 Tax=Gandjariella thermophila TaxID=1931992 RepID=A0A4D4J1E8_9PSEU|nr:hypothetical protein GTS_01020 [Gandjariella thermophila]
MRFRGGLTRWVPLPTTTPFTFWYLLTLLATTVVLRSVTAPVARRLLAAASTDAHNLQRHPLLSLVASALWLGDTHWLPYVLIFAVAIAPLERRIGAGWTAVVFASGHVVATLVTELPVLWAITAHVLPGAAGRWVDVGVSYGFFCTAGALTNGLSRQAHSWTIAGLYAVITALYLVSGPAELSSAVTFAGHLVATHVGMLCWRPWLRRRGWPPSGPGVVVAARQP